ncbi:MAG: serine O-acetyltransferase [Prevotella sp.]
MDNDIFQKNVDLLSQVTAEEARMVPRSDAPLPSVQALREVVDLVRTLVFPGFFDKRQTDKEVRSYHIGVNMERLLQLLQRQTELALLFCEECDEDAKQQAATLALNFIDRLPEIKRLLYTDVEAIFSDDPAVRTYSEVIFSYPVIQAMIHYRTAHALLEMGIPVIPRIITEMAHANTGIDIHPGAKIGEYFSIDHGTGVVIGETCIIGNHVTLYQGVTLGAKNYKLENGGQRVTISGDFPRHPILEDRVTIYSNSTLLGPITIGHDTVIGGNIWLTHSVPPESKILQSKALDVSFTGGLGI